jgi:hypothetical protein
MVKEHTSVWRNRPVALQGTIDTFELTEVVRLLAAGRKTGVLRLEGSRGTGRLWVDEGKVTAVEVDHAPNADGHAEAMFELLRFDDGAFTFVPDERTADGGEPTDLEEILGEAEAQLAEWREIEKVVPTTRATVTLRPELSRADVVLDKQRWRLVAAIGGGVTVATLGEGLGLGELPISRAVKDLIELGVADLSTVVVEEPEPAPVVVVEEPEPEPVIEPEAVVEPDPVAFEIEPELVDDTPSIAIGPDTVFDEPEFVEAPVVESDNSARAQLDEFAIGFGLSDAPAFEDPVDRAPETEPTGLVGDFSDFGSESSTTSFLDEPLFAGQDDGFGSAAFEPVDDGRDPFAEVAALGNDAQTPFLGGGNDAAEVARQLSNLSPAAARAVAAAAKATTDEEREAALAAVAQEGEEPIDRELLLRFLASVKS